MLDTTSDRAGPSVGPVGMVRRLLSAAGVLATVPLLASLVLRQVDVTTPDLVAYVAATPVIVGVGIAAIILFLLGGSRVGTAVAAVLTVILALTQAPLYLGDDPAAEGASTFTVLTVNMHYGGGDADQIVAAARDHGVDLLATQELTNPAVEALREAGIDDVLAHHVLKPGGSHGNGLWSRHPLDERATPDGFVNDPVAATLQFDGQALFVACVHPVSPYPDGALEWSRELARLADWLGGIDGPAVVAGDFNSTLDHRQFRTVLETGWADAASQAGAGWLPTYPANRRRLPLLVTIDHVLASEDIVATDVERIDIDGTDHAALLVRLAVPPRV